MPEGDSLRRTAAHLRVLEGQTVAVEAPHPRAASLGIARRIDGKRLDRVEAVGKNLLLTFEDGTVLRSHLRMRGRWQVRGAGAPGHGTPWLVLRGAEHEAVLWNGPILELGRGSVDRLGPDIMDDVPDFERMISRFREAVQSRELGEAMLDQRLVAGIGNIWRTEALHLAGLSPWRTLGDCADEELRAALAAAASAMRGERRSRYVYGRAGLPCRRCASIVVARKQGDDARTVYWCPACQAGTDRAKA